MSGYWASRSDESRARISRSYRRFRDSRRLWPGGEVLVFHRLFTVEEANRLLPSVRPLVERIVGARRRVAELTFLAGRLRREGAAAEELAACLREMEEQKLEIHRLLRELTCQGLLVCDPDRGMVHFPAVVGRAPAYLCWSLSEERVGHWHSADEDPTLRRPLPPAR